MINSSVIISGEASETDSEDNESPKVSSAMTASIQGAVITGEDSESDDENGGSISSAVSAIFEPMKKEERSELTGESTRNDSLLHKKLRESNGQLYSDIDLFCDNLINQAGKNLAAIDQQLLKSQVTLQTAVTSLRSLNINSALFRDKFQSVLSSKFIPNIKTNN